MTGVRTGGSTTQAVAASPARPVLSVAVEARAAFDDSVRKIRAIVGADASIAIARPDAAGRLRVVRRDGLLPPQHRDRAARRRTALAERRSVLRRLDCGHAVGIIPLTTDAHTIGVLEVVADAAELVPAWDLVQLIAAQLALTAESLAQRALMEREAETLQQASALASRLVRARTTDDAMVMAVRFLADRFHVPVAGWCPDEADDALRLTALGGVGVARRAALTEAFADLGTAPGGLDPQQRDALAERFRTLADVPSATSPDAGAAVLVVGRRGDPIEGSLDAVASLLADVLRLVAAATTAARRHARLDMGLAWTAHELHRPLVGVRAALEAIGNRHDPREAAIVSSSVRELDNLMGTTEALLGWASGTKPLRPTRQDVVPIVEEAIASCRLETGATVGARAPRRAFAEVDRTHVRTAIANLLRNAATHADAGTEVEVRVRADNDRITVSVTDEGPQIPAAERGAIFEPFVRGEVSVATRNGAGLGLFITRRIVEAHGGAAWVDSGPHRTTFHVSLPIAAAPSKEVRRSAS
jgi:signal transduction histidine kinase